MMRPSVSALLLVSLGFLGISSAGEEACLVLTDEDFNSKLEALDNVLVMFYAPW
jgi:hypothetical protein